MKDNIYTNLTPVSPLSSTNNYQLDKYKAIIEKLLQQGPNDKPNFQNQLQKLNSAEICLIQIKQK